jgi:hypothetical protein
MEEQLVYQGYQDLEFIKVLPRWAQELANKYRSKTTNLYLLYGNIRDFLPHEMNPDEFTFTRIQDYISEVLFGNQDHIIYYDYSSGVTFCTEEMALDYRTVIQGLYPQAEIEDIIAADPRKSFFYLEKYFLAKMPKKGSKPSRVVLIMDYAESFVPSGDLSA